MQNEWGCLEVLLGGAGRIQGSLNLERFGLKGLAAA